MGRFVDTLVEPQERAVIRSAFGMWARLWLVLGVFWALVLVAHEVGWVR